MCSIHLIIDKNSAISETPICKMISSMNHRGPDASHFLQLSLEKQPVFIGNNRLKISDLSDQANQPMVSEDGKYMLCFNGEIYNHLSLRNQLKNYHFRTHSDTETLLYWLIEYGETKIGELNGMFSFLFINLHTHTIQICRDRYGMKPLYYFQNTDFLIVSSEIKGILASGLVEKKLDASQISHYLTFRFPEPGKTFFDNILEFETGKIYSYANRQFKKNNIFFEGKSHDAVFSGKEVENVEYLLFNSVKNHLKADVPIGLFLSGGVDSTLLLAISNELGYKNLPAFCISNQKLTHDANYAKKAAKQYGAELFEIETSSSLLSGFDQFIEKNDQPIADSASWLTYLLSGEAQKQGLKAVVSGAGADELFAGYNRHLAYSYYLKYYDFFTKNSGLIKKTASLWPSKFRLLQKFIQQISENKEQTIVNFTALLPLFGVPLSPFHPVNFDFLTYDRENFLKYDVLKLTDQFAMQASVEVRLPYLDLELASFAATLKPDFLLKKGNKWILKELLSKKNGKEYTRRKKEGLGFPFGKWLFEPNGKPVLERLQKPGQLIFDYVPENNIQKIIKSHQSGENDYTSELWAVALLSGWLEKNFN